MECSLFGNATWCLCTQVEGHLQNVASGLTDPDVEFKLNPSAFWKRKRPESWQPEQVTPEKDLICGPASKCTILNFTGRPIQMEIVVLPYNYQKFSGKSVCIWSSCTRWLLEVVLAEPRLSNSRQWIIDSFPGRSLIGCHINFELQETVLYIGFCHGKRAIKPVGA